MLICRRGRAFRGAGRRRRWRGGGWRTIEGESGGVRGKGRGNGNGNGCGERVGLMR